MPPSKDPFSANIHPNILQFSVHIPQGMCFRKIERAPFENASVGATNPFEITVRTPYSKGPFSANIHRIIPKLSVPIPQGMCFRKMVGGALRKCTGWGPKPIWNHPYHPSRYHWNLIQCHILRAHYPRIYIRSFPQFLCPYLRACAFEKWWKPPPKMHGLWPKIHLTSPLAPQPVPLKLDSMPPSKGPFSANIHPINSQNFCAYTTRHMFSKNFGGPLRKCTGWGPKSIWNHP